MTNVPEVAAPRSSLLNSLAWTFIVLGGFATAISLLQNIMVSVMFPVDEMRDAMERAHRSQAVPAFAVFMFNHMRLFLGTFLAVCVLTLVSAIGLLKRKEWARLTFVGLMLLGVIWNVLGVFLPYFMFSSFPPVPTTAPPEFQDEFERMAKIIIGFTTVMAIVFAVLFGWVAKRLMSAEIKQEFHAL
jgi:hypothetical protein